MPTRPAAATFAAAAVIAAALSSCSSTPATMTVNGTVCTYDDPVSDPSPLQVGNQVTVTDPSGNVIGSAQLDGEARQGAVMTLTFGWTVKVPEGKSFYGVTVEGLSGPAHQFTQAQMKAGPAIAAGDGC